ncbi:transglycosylase domain-containing protein [Sphingomonas kaistensis]
MARQPVRPRSAPAAAEPGLGIGGWLLRLFKWGLVAALLGMIALGVAVAVAYTQLPSYQSLSNRSDLGQNIRVRSADGKLLVQLGPNLGQWIPYERIPGTMRAAMIAVEDKRFRHHPGVDPIGMARSLKVRAQTGRWSQGGSTITQQLARNIFLSNTRTFARKLREAVLAMAIEAKFSKNQILELYLNRVYFGGGAYGIDAASRTFFGHSASRLSLGEATVIAGLVKAPSNYSPTADVEAARGRAGVVLQSMVDNGFVTADAAASVDPAQIVVQPSTKQNSVRYFTDWALPQLDTLIDETSEPIEVWTTLDTNMQAAGDRAINANTPNGAQGALVALDRDGAVRAMIGGRDYVSSIYNRATQAQRQPGSAFKLFVYLAALESGMKPTTTVVDEPVDVEGWRPRNSTRSFLGPVSLREAFARSINTVSAKIGAELGFGTIADMARRFGITSPISTYPSMVLGTADVRLIDMTRAYAAVSNRGISVSPYAITRVTSADGRLLYRHSATEDRVLVAPWVAAGMTDLLQTAVMSGTGRAAQIGRPVAGKTGTTQSNRDGWFIGFSSGITTGVWMGRDDAKAISGLQGGTAPAGAFRDFMVKAVANRPVEQFQTEVPMPDWQLEPGEESFLGNDQFALDPLIDENGNPIETPTADPLGPEPITPQPVTQPGPAPEPTEVDRIFGQPPVDRRAPTPAPAPTPPPAPRERPVLAPTDGTQRRAEPTQF